MFKKLIYGLLIVLVVIQFIRSAPNQQQGPFAHDITNAYPMPKDVSTALKKACYDCHSNQTTYPWYSMIQPLGWWLQHHVDEGKEHLNFHEFGSYKLKKQDHKLEEIGEAVSEGWMPLDSYRWMHAEADLNEQEKTAILNWVKVSRQKTGITEKENTDSESSEHK